MHCKICGTTSSVLFKKKILNKYEISYFICPTCEFIQTEEPYWLAEAYKDPINLGDVGYIQRNISANLRTTSLLHYFFGMKGKFIDYGGGYGMFVRLMRDAGFQFFLEDKYCENLFAKRFEYQKDTTYDALTAFEVFEHLPSPMDELQRMRAFSDTIIFSTTLYPKRKEELENWWYLGLYHGQHVALYNAKTLSVMAQKLNLQVVSDGKEFHMFTPKKISITQFKWITKPVISLIYFNLTKKFRKSLLEVDAKGYV